MTAPSASGAKLRVTGTRPSTRLLPSANRMSRPAAPLNSLKAESRARQRDIGLPGQRRRCSEPMLRTLVTSGSTRLHASEGGASMRRRDIDGTRYPSAAWTIGEAVLEKMPGSGHRRINA